jgi:hypothetical protein
MSSEFVYPTRKKIDKELLKVSDFTEQEISILNWSSKYKAYGDIVRYNKKNVEQEFRNKDWFKKAMFLIK